MKIVYLSCPYTHTNKDYFQNISQNLDLSVLDNSTITVPAIWRKKCFPQQISLTILIEFKSKLALYFRIMWKYFTFCFGIIGQKVNLKHIRSSWIIKNHKISNFEKKKKILNRWLKILCYLPFRRKT